MVTFREIIAYNICKVLFVEVMTEKFYFKSIISRFRWTESNVNSFFKGTVSVILSDSLFKDGNVRFTRIHFKALFDHK